MNKLNYRYYFFLLKKKYDIESILNIDETRLYAYTDEKDIAELFIQFHDMQKFKMKEREITKEEVCDLARNYFNFRLERMVVKTKYSSTQYQEIPIAITKDEHHMVEMDINHDKFKREYQFLNPIIFTNDILTSLCKLGYYEGYLSPDTDDLRNQINKYIHIEVDYLYYYVRNFGDLLTKKGVS